MAAKLTKKETETLATVFPSNIINLRVLLAVLQSGDFTQPMLKHIFENSTLFKWETDCEEYMADVPDYSLQPVYENPTCTDGFQLVSGKYPTKKEKRFAELYTANFLTFGPNNAMCGIMFFDQTTKPITESIFIHKPFYDKFHTTKYGLWERDIDIERQYINEGYDYPSFVMKKAEEIGTLNNHWTLCKLNY